MEDKAHWLAAAHFHWVGVVRLAPLWPAPKVILSLARRHSCRH